MVFHPPPTNIPRPMSFWTVFKGMPQNKLTLDGMILMGETEKTLLIISKLDIILLEPKTSPAKPVESMKLGLATVN